MKTLVSQRVNTYLTDEGSGAPILFLHGAPDSAEMWNGVMSRLRDRYRCLAADLPGFGRSAAPADFDYALDNQARWVDGVVTALGLTEPVSLAMHDFGGHFGLAWAIRHPDKVRRLVISNTSFFSDYRWHSGARLLRTPLVGELGMLMTSYRSLRQIFHTGSPGLSEAHIQQSYALLTPGVRRSMLRLYRTTDPKNFKGWEDELLKLTKQVPTMVLWGDADPFVDSNYAERFGAQTVIHFVQYGHWLPVEGAAEVAEHLNTFL